MQRHELAVIATYDERTADLLVNAIIGSYYAQFVALQTTMEKYLAS